MNCPTDKWTPVDAALRSLYVQTQAEGGAVVHLLDKYKGQLSADEHLALQSFVSKAREAAKLVRGVIRRRDAVQETA